MPFTKYFLPLFFLLSFFFTPLTGQEDTLGVNFEWHILSTVPPAPGKLEQPGVAGAFTGIHNGALIIAGGANFPDGPVWEGSPKVYHSDIYVSRLQQTDTLEWINASHFQLPRKVGYGLSIETPEGLLCIGGTDGEKPLAESFLLQWDDKNEVIELEEWPALPLPMANMAGALIDGTVYVAASSEGDNSKYFWSLDLSNPAAGWQSLPVWPGAPRTHAVGIAQSNGEKVCFFLIKGRYRSPEGISRTFSDVQMYNPVFNRWEVIPSEEEKPEDAVFLSAGTGVPYGANHILLFGGAEGRLLNRLERLGLEIEAAQDTLLQIQLIAERDSILRNHPGFSKDIWAFHTITQTWTILDTLPAGSQVTTTAVKWEDRILIPSGEISPGIRTPNIMIGELTDYPHFGTVNTIVLVVYLLLLVLMGVYFSRNQRSTDDFFKGGQRIPWWAAGLSIFGTQLSAITFMAIPAKTYATDWLYFVLSLTIIMVYPFIIRFFLPFYRRFNLTTAYEYLELRFNLVTRLFGSILYVFLQLGRLGIVLLLPSLALSVVTGIDVSLCILVMGVLSILYTVLGGIEAVIWTDVLQVIVLLGGALLSLILLYINLDNSDIVTYIDRFDKMQIFDFSFDLTTATFWVVLFGGFATNLAQYGSDQTIIQRYLTTKDEKTAARSIATGAWMALPATLIFFTLGTLLFVYYKVHPENLNPALEKTDAIFPWFITHSLPDGVSGLLIAAIFAASMSSLDSSMNSVSAVFTTDFLRRLRPQTNEKRYLLLARWITVVTGVVGTSLALMMATWGISSLWDQFNMIVGLFTGGLGGIFLLGIFSKRTNGAGAVAGLVLSALLQYAIKEYTDVHLLLYSFTGMIAAVITGYLVSSFTGSNTPHAEDYTLAGIRRKKLES